MSMKALRVRQCHPTQEITHTTILRWLKHKMPVIGHQLVAQDTAGVTLQPLGQDSLERVIVGILLEKLASGIATIQGMVNAIRFIRSFGSRHSNNISKPISRNNDS
jgi:hypothetical protein